jgi:hypothetical protein
MMTSTQPLEIDTAKEAPVYSADLLWALLVTSPRRARLCLTEQAGSERRHPGIPEGAARYRPRWASATGALLETSARAYGNALFLACPTADASPGAFREEIRGRGLHMRAAMAKDGLWRGFNLPVEAKVIVAVEEIGTAEFPPHDDYALYSLTGELEAEGEALYRRALVQLAQAIRNGWPGWSDAGLQVLE